MSEAEGSENNSKLINGKRESGTSSLRSRRLLRRSRPGTQEKNNGKRGGTRIEDGAPRDTNADHADGRSSWGLFRGHITDFSVPIGGDLAFPGSLRPLESAALYLQLTILLTTLRPEKFHRCLRML